MNTFDMVVVGGGPAGSMTALTAADRGLDVLVVERDPAIGAPVRCAEGVDHKGLLEFFDPDPRWIAATIDSYSLVAPDGTEVRMAIGNDSGFILERLVFDRMIAEEAAGRGAAVLTGVEAISMSEMADGYRTVHLKNHETEWDVRAKVVIAADGVESRVARWGGIKTHVTPHDMETCAQATCSGIDIDSHTFKMFFTMEFAPGGYGWVFPKGKNSANVGLGISGTHTGKHIPFERLGAFLDHHFPGASVVSRTVGGVACSGGIKETFTDGLLVVGDAAHMANPLTGGGIINALIAGRAAGETAVSALSNGGANAKALAPYQKQCNKRFGDMNRRCLQVKEGIFNVPDDRLNAIAHEIAALPQENRTPVRVLRSAVFKNPRLLALLPKIMF